MYEAIVDDHKQIGVLRHLRTLIAVTKLCILTVGTVAVFDAISPVWHQCVVSRACGAKFSVETTM